MADWVPKTTLANVVAAAGFEYDAANDIIRSRMNAPQRGFGYAWAYDVASIEMSMVIHCEPFFFKYDNMLWMIELWKGQYGLETGCEIGIYNRAINPSPPVRLEYELLDVLGKRPANDAAGGLFYPCAHNDDRLNMSVTLRGKSGVILSRPTTLHWWLTGFRWGVYSEPDDLAMDVSIECHDEAMVAPFTGALDARGYTYKVDKRAVSFTFSKPKSVQPAMIYAAEAKLALAANKTFVDAYEDAWKKAGFKNNDPNNITDDMAIHKTLISHFDRRRVRAVESALVARGYSSIAKLFKLLGA